MMGDTIFVVPTIMTRPSLEVHNVSLLAKQNPNCKVFFVCNEPNDDFEYAHIYESNIEKKISGVKYSISAAINSVIEEITTEKYFCFVQSDVSMSREVIPTFRKIHQEESLNCGILGAEKHSNFHAYNRFSGNYHEVDLYQTLWTDGIMFFKTKLFKDIGVFDINYFGDKESQDFCYKAHDFGYKNYWVKPSLTVKWTHQSVNFGKKVNSDLDDFRRQVQKSRDYFRQKWDKWEVSQKSLFV